MITPYSESAFAQERAHVKRREARTTPRPERTHEIVEPSAMRVELMRTAERVSAALRMGMTV